MILQFYDNTKDAQCTYTYGNFTVRLSRALCLDDGSRRWGVTCSTTAPTDKYGSSVAFTTFPFLYLTKKTARVMFEQIMANPETRIPEMCNEYALTSKHSRLEIAE